MSSSSKYLHDNMEIPLEEIARATNNFGDQNLIHKGAFVNVYKGKLLSGWGQLGNIVIQRRLDDRVYEQWEEIFWNDLLDSFGVRRELSVVGFSGDKNIIVYKHVGDGSLREDLSDPTFSWMQRLQICLDLVSTHIDPDWKLTSGMVYRNSYFQMLYIISLGDLMFEVLCEKKGEPHVTPMAIEHYEKGELEDIINPNLRLQIHQESLIIFSKTAYNSVKHPRVYVHEIRKQLEEALSLQPQPDEKIEEFGVRIPHEEIASATNNFADQNVLHSSNYVNVYKGNVLLQSGQLGNIVVRSEFQLRAMTSSARLHRPLSVVGFSSDKRIIVYEHVGNGILKKDVSDPTFNWMQRVSVCLDLANSWKSSAGVGFNNTYFEMVYVISLADLMFEVLCEKKEEHPTTLRRAIEHYEKGRLENIIHPHLSLQMHHQSLTIFIKTAYKCLQQPWIIDFDMHRFDLLEHQMHHEKYEPCIIDVVKEGLEKALELQMEHEKYLERIKIELKDIRLSTNNFAKEHVIGSGTYGTVYKAELEYFDRKTSLVVRDTVAIKRISKRQDGLGDQGFFAELNMLSCCEHNNIISLLGFCHEGSKRILVYEYAFKQSLSEYLGSTNDKIILTWAKRLQICLDIAHGLDYLHNNTEHKPRIIHRDVKSDNILLGKNWNAKIGDFGLSKFHPMNQQASTINTEVIAGTPFYLDPEYEKTGQLKKESDVYSFGVVLFEILSGRLAYDPIYLAKNNNGLPSIARQCFNEGALKEIVDHQMKEPDELIPIVYYGPNQDSLYTFVKIAYRCLAETQIERPTIKEIIKELQIALNFQENRDDILLKLSFEDLNLGTENFSDNKCIVRGASGKAYSGKIQYRNELKDIVAMRLYRCRHEDDLSLKKKKEDEFLQELEFLMKHKHENIVDLVGYCKEENEKVIVYELASIGSLDMHLGNAIIGWVERLKICIDVASALDFLHEGVQVIHRDIRSASILLNGDWRAKISDFGLSFVAPIDKKMEDYDMNDVFSTPGYCDPSYWGMGFLTKESDIYSLGVVLFEILCGITTMENYNHEGQFLDDSVKKLFEETRLDEIVFGGIKPQIVSHSLIIFQKIAIQCLHHRRQKRPTAAEVVIQLKKALDLQMEPSSAGGMNGERVRSSIDGKCFNIGHPHADGSEDNVAASQARVDDVPTGPEPREDVEEVAGIRGSAEKDLDCLHTPSEALLEEVGFDRAHDSKLSLMGLQTSSSTEKSYVVSRPLEAQELIEKNENMKYQQELETQLQAERARNSELVARVADLEARVAENSELVAKVADLEARVVENSELVAKVADLEARVAELEANIC